MKVIYRTSHICELKTFLRCHMLRNNDILLRLLSSSGGTLADETKQIMTGKYWLHESREEVYKRSQASVISLRSSVSCRKYLGWLRRPC